jgi:2-oxoglutarate dehydrogenase E1 component
MNLWEDFHGPNAGYVIEVYERYRQDPRAVDPATQVIFDQWRPPGDGDSIMPAAAIGKLVATVRLAQAIREYGHLAAQMDPLGTKPPGDPSLKLATYGLPEEDLRQLPASLIDGPITQRAANALEAIQALRSVYSSTTGYEYDQIRLPVERDWLRQAAESRRFRPPEDPIDPEALLERLTQVEVFERFLHRTFPGKFRFSIEGLDMMVPILDEAIGAAAESGMHNILLGMAHRGRLNVLAHVLNKPFAQILAEFKDPLWPRDFSHGLGWTGDVKYHKGARRAVKDGIPIDLVITLPPNPSHLESIDPVVEGMARAAGSGVDRRGPPRFDPAVALPILIHGDAAFPGQGVVAETLNFSRVPGYRVGGTIHIIANNQLGYTTPPEASRSTLYASDLAKGFKIPIVHVNADDPEACVEAGRLAFAYRAQFQKDFLIDLVGYRRHGHNEGDEPGFTQPVMYRKIEHHPTVRELWAKTLIQRGTIAESVPEELVRRHMEKLQSVLDSLVPEKSLVEPQPQPPPPGAARELKTSVTVERLRELNEALLRVPANFAVNSKLQRAIRRRREALESDKASIDWATAESLAFASILGDGIPIRLTGQDTERGTFSQRHASFYDVETGERFTPLQALPQARAAFEVRNSPLTEEAAVGFEYGYNIQKPEQLVIWEAQYGDFINEAQVMVDEFITSARAKWGQTPSLVLLLPHGYEGQGPDHCSARVERFLQLAVNVNVRVANCTTAAQYFHLLRRQAGLLLVDPLPLVVLTPKSLLRNPQVASPLQGFAEGGWQPVIDDGRAQQRPQGVRRLILCSGKIYVDLVTSDHREENARIAIVRVEQLYPFPADSLRPVLDEYRGLEEVVWVQEEPENMGTWKYLQPCLRELVGGRWPIHYIGRPPSSSPGEGSSAWFAINQQALVEQASNEKSEVGQKDIVWLKTKNFGKEKDHAG